MGTAVPQPRHNRTITVAVPDEATSVRLRHDGKAFVEFVLAFGLTLGFQRTHTVTCRGGGCLPRHSHDVRVRLGGLPIWRIQCTRCKAVCTVLPHGVLRSRSLRPEVARHALLATQGGLRLERCAVLSHLALMALSRRVCAFGPHSRGPVLTRCGLSLPTDFLADEKHSRGLTAKVYVPTMVQGRGLWHLGDTEEASAAVFPPSYGGFPRAASPQNPT